MGVEGCSSKTPDSCQTCQSQGCVCISLSLCLEGPVGALAVNWAAKVKQAHATEWTAHSQGCQIIPCNGKTPGQVFSHSKNKMQRARFAPPLPQLMPTGSQLRSLCITVHCRDDPTSLLRWIAKRIRQEPCCQTQREQEAESIQRNTGSNF